MFLRTPGQWIDAYQKRNGLWFHDGDMRKPHAELASGNHSSGFFNSRVVIADEELLRQAAHDLRQLFQGSGLKKLNMIDVVVGPQTGATLLARFVSDSVGEWRNRACATASPAKDAYGKPTLFTKDELSSISGRRILLCEDVITTGESVQAVADAVHATCGTCLPYVLTLVNRSGLTHVGKRRILALISRPMPIWTPEKCPLCAAGSKAVRPKDNWHLLNV